MPFITIQSLPFNLDVKEIVKKLCSTIGENTSFAEDRIMIQWDFHSPQAYVRHGFVVKDFYDPHYSLVVNLTCSLRNSKEEIDKLVQVLVDKIAELINFDSTRISVVINAKEPGFIYAGKKFI